MKTVEVTREVWKELENLRAESKAGSLNQVTNLLLLKYNSTPNDKWTYSFVNEEEFNNLMKTLNVEEK
jgi:hypothetical protein